MDVEVNFSGYTGEGLQVVWRNYLFSLQNDAANAVDCILDKWGAAMIK